MHLRRSVVSSLIAASRRCSSDARRSVPTTRVRRCRRPRSSASSRARPRNRWPTPRGSRCSTTRRCRRSFETAIANNLDLRVAVARVEEARARAGIAKSFLYPQIDFAANYGIASGVERLEGERFGRRGHDPPERRLRLPAVLGTGFVRSHPSREGGCPRARAGERPGPPRRARHAHRRCRDELLPASRARLAARDRATDARPQRRNGHLFPEPSGWRRLESARARSDRRQPGADRQPRFPKSNSRSPSSKTRCRCCSDGRPERSRGSRSRPAKRFRRPFRRAFRRPCWSAAPTSRKPNSCWLPPTPTSAWRRRCSFRRSA